MAGLDGIRPDDLKVCTLTAPGADKLPDESAIKRWNLDAARCWMRFVKQMRRRFPGIEFWGVWEYQERGALHRHFLIRGVKFIPLALFRELAIASGFGPRVELARVKRARGGTRALLGYFTGYLLKAVSEWNRRMQVITMTRGWALTWRQRRQRRGPARFAWISEREWWWEAGRAETLGELGAPGADVWELAWLAEVWPYTSEDFERGR